MGVVLFQLNKDPSLESLGTALVSANSVGSAILEKWFPLQGERAHCLKLFCMYDKRFEISKTK